MRPKDKSLGESLRSALADFRAGGRALPILNQPERLDCLVEQLVESVRRNSYVSAIQLRTSCPQRMDPHSGLFDPYRAAVLHQHKGEIEQALWLVFQATHFGKHRDDQWGLFRDVYGRLNNNPIWTWVEITNDFGKFERWFDSHLYELRALGHRFSNHRKYQRVPNTRKVFRTYIEWTMRQGGQMATISHAVRENANGPPREVFDYLYNAMDAVFQFGRLGKFDFLCMVGKLGLAPIEPGSTYLTGATGPYLGAKLLFGVRSRKECDDMLIELDRHLHVGMQAIEDALCNWQKSPDRFMPFRT